MTMTRNNAKAFMTREARHMIRESKDGEANLTELAESCCAKFNCDHLGGPLDDQDHPVWDWAIEAADWAMENAA